MYTYPLFFIFKQVIPCDNFCAIIEAKGKVLMVNEDDKWWLYGVQPGGMAECGETPKEGLENYSIAFKEILLDLAEDSKTPEEFDQKARDFFFSVGQVDKRRWEAARKALKAEKIQCPAEIDNLHKETSDIECAINIILYGKKVRASRVMDILPEDEQYRCAA